MWLFWYLKFEIKLLICEYENMSKDVIIGKVLYMLDVISWVSWGDFMVVLI